MSILKPFDTAMELVRDAKVTESSKSLDPRERAKEALDRNGASIDDASIAIADCLADEKHRLNAAKLVMEMQGAIVKEQKNSVPSITLNIVGAGRTLIQMVTPK